MGIRRWWGWDEAIEGHGRKVEEKEDKIFHCESTSTLPDGELIHENQASGEARDDYERSTEDVANKGDHLVFCSYKNSMVFFLWRRRLGSRSQVNSSRPHCTGEDPNSDLLIVGISLVVVACLLLLLQPPLQHIHICVLFLWPPRTASVPQVNDDAFSTDVRE